MPMFKTQTCISDDPASVSQAPSNSVVSPYASIDHNVQKLISSVEEPFGNEDSSETEGMGEAEDGDRPVNRTYFINCQAVYTNSFNAKGVKVKNSGNHTPQVSYRGGTVVVHDKRPTSPSEGASLSNSSVALAQSSRSLDARLDSTLGSPPVLPQLPFQLSSSAQSWRPSDLAIEIPKPYSKNNPFRNQSMDVPPVDIALPILEDGHVSMSSRKRCKLTTPIETKVNAATYHFTPKMPGSQPFPVNPFLPIHTGLLPPNLGPFPGTFQSPSPNNITVNPLRDTDPQHHPAESRDPSLDTTPKKHLEYLLESALATALAIQTSGMSSSADILSPRAHNTLKALNALVAVEMPVSGPKTCSFQ